MIVSQQLVLVSYETEECWTAEIEDSQIQLQSLVLLNKLVHSLLVVQ